MFYQIAAFLSLALFYGVYIGKMVAQRRKGIQTDQMARGKKPRKVFATELVMKIATYSVVAVEAASIFLAPLSGWAGLRALGLILAFAGVAVFALAVWTMRDSWRAGIPETDQTKMVTSGIYRFSRNPAFLGFDLLYLGHLLLFFNWVLLAFTVLAMAMLHLQILQEERYLPTVFGKPYLAYKARVFRYFGRR